MKIGFFNNRDEPGQFNTLASLKSLFEKNGITYADHDGEVDLILARPEKLVTDEGRPYLASGKPILVLERADPASFGVTVREIITHPSVIGVFKNRILRRCELYNYPTAAVARYHSKLINDYAHLEDHQALPYLDQETLAKVQMVTWDFESSFVHPRYDNEHKLWRSYRDFEIGAHTRDIDVLYLGSAGVYSPMINWHREKFTESLKNLTDLKTLTEGRYDYPEYAALMRRAKVAVSPWGWGEWCWRDVEAIYFGCTLVKPDTDFVLAYPDIFRDDMYYRCAPDASDLKAAVTCALANWDSEIEKRYKRRIELLELRNIEQMMAKLSSAIHRVYDGR